LNGVYLVSPSMRDDTVTRYDHLADSPLLQHRLVTAATAAVPAQLSEAGLDRNCLVTGSRVLVTKRFFHRDLARLRHSAPFNRVERRVVVPGPDQIHLLANDRGGRERGASFETKRTGELRVR
jgi:hypothetical protein